MQDGLALAPDRGNRTLQRGHANRALHDLYLNYSGTYGLFPVGLPPFRNDPATICTVMVRSSAPDRHCGSTESFFAIHQKRRAIAKSSRASMRIWQIRSCTPMSVTMGPVSHQINTSQAMHS